MKTKAPSDAWDMIASNLDKPTPVPVERRRILILLALLFILAPFTFWLMMPAAALSPETAGSVKSEIRKAVEQSTTKVISPRVSNHSSSHSTVSQSEKNSDHAPAQTRRAIDLQLYANGADLSEQTGSEPFAEDNSSGTSAVKETDQTVMQSSAPGLPGESGLALSRVHFLLQFNLRKDSENQLVDSHSETDSSITHFEKNWYAGINFQGSGILLLNTETFGALSSSGLNQVRLKPGPSWGIHAGYQFGKSTAIEFGYTFRKSGQHFLLYDEGFVRDKITTMNIHTAGIVLRKRFSGSDKNDKGFYGLSGFEMSMLTSIHTRVDEQDISSDALARFSAALSLGMEYVIPLSANMNLRSQLITAMGLNNVYTGTKQVPASFMRTHLADLRLGIALTRKF